MKNGKKLKIVLAGQANVGKSVIFNYLTGLHQHIGNWPGKTVEKAEGTLFYKGYTIDVFDLPGIYALTTYSLEEIVSRDYIALQKPDFVVNVVDSTNLERNLLFTLQLLELERPVILALNMVNLLKEKGIEINTQKLQELLQIPVIPVAAIYGKGITEVVDRGIELIKSNTKETTCECKLKFGKEVEERIEQLIRVLKDVDLSYPKRWLAIKLLEKDKEIEKLVKDKEILTNVEKLTSELEEIHGHDSSVVIANERCYLASLIIKQTVKITKPAKIGLNVRLDSLTSDRILGYPVMIGILALMYLTIFTFGSWFLSFLEELTSGWQILWENIFGNSFFTSLGWSTIESALALIQIALPYIIPFYFLLFLLEDWGYLARVAYLTDNLMHKLGVHGKACIPLMLGFGCNIPGCLSCRIMETERERFLTAFLTTLIPCSAVTVIIMGLVGKFLGVGWAFGLYLFNILIILIVGKLASKILPGEPTELIMEMPDYRLPNLRTIILQTWFRLKEFIFLAGPLVVISGVVIKGIHLAGWLEATASFLSPITVKWLDLPAITGVLLIFGILRKELILVMLATLLGTTNFVSILTPVQMLTLSILSMFYIPCVATIAVLLREFGWKKTLGICIFEIFFAISLAGTVSRILPVFL